MRVPTGMMVGSSLCPLIRPFGPPSPPWGEGKACRGRGPGRPLLAHSPSRTPRRQPVSARRGRCPHRPAAGEDTGPYGDTGAVSPPVSLRSTAPSSEGAKKKSLPLTREVAGQRPDGGRERAATMGHSCGDTYHVGPRPTRLPPLRGKLSAVRLTDEGAHGDDGRFFPLPPHPALRATFPPVGGRQGAPGSRPRPASLGPSGQFTFSRPTQAARFCP